MAAKRKPVRSSARSKPAARKKPAAASIQPISPCLWFDGQAEEAARFYVSVFKKGKVKTITHYPKAGHEIHQKLAGTVLTVEFELNGQRFLALNGGPNFKFNEAVSLMVLCETQAEIDYYWDKLTAGGDPNARQCGWLKDKYGLSWQVAPKMALTMWKDPWTPGKERAFMAMMDMKKMDIAKLKAALKGK
jgi:predicted 3-demethylubiquinone-9 3-methyltransferase (glyoxalase superfamily)